MIPWIILIVFVVVIVIGVVINNLKKKVAFDEVELYCSENKLTYRRTPHSLHDLEIEGDTFILCVKMSYIPKNSSVTVNSQSTWVLRFGGHRPGRHYPNKQYMNELKPFLGADYSNPMFFQNMNNKKIQKVVVLHPSTENVLKYVNESDIITLSSKDVAYGVKIIKANKFKEEFENLL